MFDSVWDSFCLDDRFLMYVLPVLDPSLTTNVGAQSVQAGKVIGRFPSSSFLLSLSAGLVFKL